jgi:hypothetical protein
MSFGTVIALWKAGKVVIPMFYIMAALIGIGFAVKSALKVGMSGMHRA